MLYLRQKSLKMRNDATLANDVGLVEARGVEPLSENLLI